MGRTHLADIRPAGVSVLDSLLGFRDRVGASRIASACALHWRAGKGRLDSPCIGGGMAIVLVFTVLVAALTTHARALIRHDDATAEAYLLYDDMGFVPHWLFDLGFYPIALAATDRWGQGSVVTRPLTPERLAAAVSEGRFVFVLSHGTEDGLYTADFRVRPNEAAPHGTGEDLQLVYITGCDNGLLAREWEETLAPARVITFPRLSAWIEHIYWLLVTGPGEVGGLN